MNYSKEDLYKKLELDSDKHLDRFNRRLIDEWQLNFLKSVSEQYSAKEYLSDKQLNILEKIYRQIHEPSLASVDKPEYLRNCKSLPNMSGVYKLLDKPKGFAKIRLDLNGLEFTIYKATEKSKYFGQLQLTADNGELNKLYIGRIDKEGQLNIYPNGKPHTENVVNLLTELSQNPSEVASRYGKLTGSCSFCRRTLSDERSKEVGYGKRCAEIYGLNY